MKDALWRLAHMEPALLRGLIIAAFALLASVGILVSPELPNSLVGAVLALLAVVQAVWTRAAVTPNAQVAVKVPDPAQPDVVAPGAATTTASSSEIVEAARAAG